MNINDLTDHACADVVAYLLRANSTGYSHGYNDCLESVIKFLQDRVPQELIDELVDAVDS
jgi:hypothetical protein